VRTLTQAAVHTVERAFHGHVGITVIHLTLCPHILGVAYTRPIVAPPSRPAVVRASPGGAVEASETWLTPTSAAEAQAVVGAIVKAKGLGAVTARVLGCALALAIHTTSLVSTSRGAALQ
jgi:hypothetical protein